MRGVALSRVAPQGRTPLSADALLRRVRSGVANIPDHRDGATEIALAEALMAAFAMFALQAPSLLAFDTHRAEGHRGTIDALDRVPCDTPMRERLDPVSPEAVRPLLTSVLGQLQRGKALEPRACLEDHDWWSLEGTGYCSSKTIHGASWLPKVHRHGSITYDHPIWGAAMVHPDKRAVMPVIPEPLVKHEGTDNNDCERHAAQRFMAKWRQDHPHRKCIVTEDRLSSHAPHLETLHAHGLHDLLGVKDGDQA